MNTNEWESGPGTYTMLGYRSKGFFRTGYSYTDITRSNKTTLGLNRKPLQPIGA